VVADNGGFACGEHVKGLRTIHSFRSAHVFKEAMKTLQGRWEKAHDELTLNLACLLFLAVISNVHWNCVGDVPFTWT
jgi:hypothetical protein